MAQTIDTLIDFIDRATKSRKYPENTASGLKAALKLFETVLNEEERESLDTFKKNIDQIYQSLSIKNGKNFTSSSLAAYKYRILKLLNDYEKYGIDPTKMAGWSPKIKNINRDSKKQSSAAQNEGMAEAQEMPASTAGIHRLEVALRPGIKAVIIIPMDITSAESTRIKGVLDSLVV